MYDFTKSLEENQKLAASYATKLASATFDFNKKLFDANTEILTAVREQAVESAKTMGIKIPGFDK